MASRRLIASSRHRFPAIARGFLLSGLVLLLLGVSFARVGAPRDLGVTVFSAGAPPGGGSHDVNLTVNLTDRPSFDPADLNVGPSSVLHLTLVNTGGVGHTFTVSSVPNFVLPTTWAPSQLSSFFNANASWLNVSVPASSTVLANLTLPPSAVAGNSYEVVSVLPYQFQAGMHGFLNVSGGSLGPGVVVPVQASDAFRFIPDTLAVNATTFPVTVDVHATNIGAIPHTWTVASQSNVTLTSGNFSAYFQAHPPMGRVVLQNGGSSNWTNFSVAKPGIYEFICEVQGHFANGMFGLLYVGVAPPAAAAPISTAIVQEGVLAGAASLLVVGGVFAIAAAYVGRFPRSPPGGSHYS